MSLQVNLTPNKSSQDISNFSQSASINSLPKDLLLEIFKELKLKDILSARLVCGRWKKITISPLTIYGRYLNETNNIKRFSFLPPRFSAWLPMPQHWEVHSDKDVLKFSSIKRNIIAFHPPYYSQSSQFFSFSSSTTPFSDRNTLLGQHGDTYFLTPQGKHQWLEFSTDLQPLASHKLVAINIKDRTKNREFSLLRNLPPSQDNLSRCQIEYCFPLSENNIVLMTTTGEISFWDLSSKIPKDPK